MAGNKEHISFRNSKVWKLFRIQKLKEVNNTCEMCGTKRPKGKGLHIHHLCNESYARLYSPWFKVLCPSCHKYILERFLTKKDWGRYEHFIKAWLADFIPFGMLGKGYPVDYDKIINELKKAD
jgi:hypothetical protein